MNRGRPPAALYTLWKTTPGDAATRLVTLGLVGNSKEWTMRKMGSLTEADHAVSLPYAVVLEKRQVEPFSPSPAKAPDAPPRPIMAASPSPANSEQQSPEAWPLLEKRPLATAMHKTWKDHPESIRQNHSFK